MTAHFEQVFEAILLEAFYCDYRNQCLQHSARPLPRGREVFNKIRRVVDELVQRSVIYRQEMDAYNYNGRIKVVSS